MTTSETFTDLVIEFGDFLETITDRDIIAEPKLLPLLREIYSYIEDRVSRAKQDRLDTLAREDQEIAHSSMPSSRVAGSRTVSVPAMVQPPQG